MQCAVFPVEDCCDDCRRQIKQKIDDPRLGVLQHGYLRQPKQQKTSAANSHSGQEAQ